MPNAFTLIEHIQNGGYDPLFSRMYTKEQIADQRSRYITAVKAFVEVYGDRDNLFLFSAPGRTEIGGNHTDHNNGVVIAAAVNLDIIASIRIVNRHNLSREDLLRSGTATEEMLDWLSVFLRYGISICDAALLQIGLQNFAVRSY